MSDDLHVIVGMGVTALSCARFLTQQQIPIAMADTREHPPQLDAFMKAYPGVPTHLGALENSFLDKAKKLIVSPGVSIHEPAIVRQAAKGTTVVGDIELFAHVAKAPIIAITGTNAKSTVTTLVGMMAIAAGLRTEMGGNLGTPALDLLKDFSAQVFVLELSSFQLETTYSLAPKVAAILNVTPDHMDRYDTVEDYRSAKLRIYSHCEIAVCNRDDPATDPGAEFTKRKIQFTLQAPRSNEFGLVNNNGKTFLAFEDQALMPVSDLPILGKHYQANALAALAIGYAFGLPMEPMLQTLRIFKGLEHRCQLVHERNHVRWYNDSKGTNVGATLAAIDGLGPEINGKIILIAGGIGKNADFSPLVRAVRQYARAVILIGEVATLLAQLLKDTVEIRFAASMDEAVAIADELARSGDSVLLSPACSSFDMFKNFEHRGKVFTEVVQGLK
jgi:UDP-N-acetylmuramoylalanine--D-glutamate ligase